MNRFLFSGLVFLLLAPAVSGCATVRDASDAAKYGQRAQGGDEGAVKALIGALSSDDKKVRDAAYDALTAAGPKAVPQLIETLSDNDPAVREYAAGALGNIGDERAVGPLLKMLDYPVSRKYVAAWALGEIKAVSAVDRLIAALGEKNEALQKESTRALIKIGKDSVPALIKALQSPDRDTRKYAARALGVIEDNRAEEPLIALLGDPDHEVTAAAALALGTTGGEKSIKPLIATLSVKDMNTQVNTSIALGQLDAKDAVDPLTKIMEEDDDPYVRQWSARALENITGNRYKYKDEYGDMVFPYNLYR